MINFDEKFWLAICFLIFTILIYKPLRNFIISLLDSNINKVKNDFKNAYNILEDSKKALKNANKKLNEAIIESNRIDTEIDKIITIDIKKINEEFKHHSKSLYINNEALITKLHNNYIKSIKDQIIEEALNRVKDNFSTPPSLNQIKNIIKSI
jgi:F0F1-type ATP synthase membrane subunit b/b'